MILTCHFLILKRVNKYGTFCNNKNNDKLSQNNFLNFSKQHCLFKGVNLSVFVFHLRVKVSRLVDELVIPTSSYDQVQRLFLVSRIKKNRMNSKNLELTYRHCYKILYCLIYKTRRNLVWKRICSCIYNLFL